ncbi:MAG: hypothetical protein WDM77_07595 [Steroidobacteraceae bacterium]
MTPKLYLDPSNSQVMYYEIAMTYYTGGAGDGASTSQRMAV